MFKVFESPNQEAAGIMQKDVILLKKFSHFIAIRLWEPIWKTNDTRRDAVKIWKAIYFSKKYVAAQELQNQKTKVITIVKIYATRIV